MSNENEPVLTSLKLLAYQKSTGQLPDFSPPRTVIFVLQKSLADYALRRHSARRIKGFLGDFYLLKRTGGEIAVSNGFGIGGPAVAALTDQFAALGVKQFALIGMAGALQPELNPGSLVICNNAIRGEGVSHHYLPPALTVGASEEMAQGLSQILTKRNHSHSIGTVWTTDAPFRELRKTVFEYQRAGVLAVDMEAAALMSVARSQELPAIAMFSIADQLSDGHWKAAKGLHPVQKGLEILFDALIEILAI
jgi:uridine phosphorylase